MHCSVKFRLDEDGDIIWYNDLVVCSQDSSLASPSPTSATGTESPNDGNPCGDGVFNELASVLLACESFDIVTGDSGDFCGLNFSTYAGQTIEFKVE